MMYCVLANGRMELVHQLRLVYINSTYLQWPSLLDLPCKISVILWNILIIATILSGGKDAH